MDDFNSFYFVTRTRTGFAHEIEICQRLARNTHNSNWEAENPSEPKKESLLLSQATRLNIRFEA